MFLVRDNKDWKEFYFIEKVKNAIQAKKKLRETCEKTVLTVSVKTGFQNFDVKNAPRFWKSGWNQEDKAKVPIEANWRTTIRKIATRICRICRLFIIALNDLVFHVIMKKNKIIFWTIRY